MIDHRNVLRNILFCCFCLMSSAHSANLEFRIQGGQGHYNMPGLHNLQTEVIAELKGMSVPVKITSNFPDFYFSRVEVLHRFSQGYTGGLSWMHMETGGRIHYADYSGEISSDQILTCNGFGLSNTWTIMASKCFSSTFNMPISFLWSTLDMLDEIILLDESEVTQNELVAMGLGLDPMISLAYKVQRLSISIDGGYHLTFSKPFHLKDNSDAILRVNNKQVSPDWSGYRLGVTLGYVLFSRAASN
ncbi:MAG: hypothetical protein HOD43_14325 [Candidatus Marinimicrobia bacterium]|jgi:hypothetical protein|nr:hypothetical protein [Candidatus Neomarinimicrobiota bacterium]MBT3632018.1 hypothetical protein [Candidatus Neomarinimicrobiota bacterium]MBT3824604.1 hypothetical protein [Candidatus Neomarinimicrobiota bacterium]MBT4296972.1 hypothetical protein [Candidatus Neomarinimicrobiota bacterium]MBT4993648.1 hypothetical protein [Candidatus Neomarinimicrobiota bacterium]